MVRKFKKSGNSRWRGNSKKVEIQDSVEIQRKWKSKIARKFIEQEIQDSAGILAFVNPYVSFGNPYMEPLV